MAYSWNCAIEPGVLHATRRLIGESARYHDLIKKKKSTINTRNRGKLECLFNHTDLSRSVVGDLYDSVGVVEAVMHVFSPYILPNSRWFVVKLRYPFLQPLVIRRRNCHSTLGTNSSSSKLLTRLLFTRAEETRLARDGGGKESRCARAVQRSHSVDSIWNPSSVQPRSRRWGCSWAWLRLLLVGKYSPLHVRYVAINLYTKKQYLRVLVKSIII